MKKIVLACRALLILSLAGCEYVGNITSSQEDRINAAFPLSESVSIAKASMLKLVVGGERKEFESQLNTRLKLRALNCAKGFAPSWHTSSEEIRKIVDNKPCFAEADNEISKWLGMRRKNGDRFIYLS